MLQHIRIENLALMDRAELSFEPGFHAVTGETGAGKSVLLGALAILSGNRVEKSIIRKGSHACNVEASIYIEGTCLERVQSWLADRALPLCEEETLVLSRTVFSSKAAKISINGRLSTLANLRELGAFWIDFHGPGEPQKLVHRPFQLEMVDSFGAYDRELKAFDEAYASWKQCSKELSQLRMHGHLDEDELRFLESQLAKMQSLDIAEDTIETLEADYQRVSQAQEIAEAAQRSYTSLSGSDGALEIMSNALQAAGELSSMDSEGQALEDRLSSLIVETEDLADEFRARIDAADYHPAEIEQIQNNMQLWMELKRKHGGSVETVIEHRDSIAQKIENQGDVEGRLIELEAAVGKALVTATEAAKSLSEARQAAANRLQKEVSEVLKDLGFKKADLRIAVTPSDQLNETGLDVVDFLFSANPGSDPLPLGQIASSGEMARVMLALKTILARFDETPVLVFDEVDANVGGEIGKAVGDRLKSLAADHQVFCITHLPQVAAKGTHHWCVTKEQSEAATSVLIQDLTHGRELRLSELARMMGDRQSKTALSHARELIE